LHAAGWHADRWFTRCLSLVHLQSRSPLRNHSLQQCDAAARPVHGCSAVVCLGRRCS